MKRYILCAEDFDDIIDVEDYNNKMEDLYHYILNAVPFAPTRDRLWGKGMNYASSNQPQVYNLTFEWDSDVVDGGFELDIRIDSFNIASSISNPPDVTCKIKTFMQSKTSKEFKSAADKLMALFKFTDTIRDYVNTLF